MNMKRLLASSAIPACLMVMTPFAFAQTTITENQTDAIQTSTAADDGTAADVTISSGVSVTPASGTAVTSTRIIASRITGPLQSKMLMTRQASI